MIFPGFTKTLESFQQEWFSRPECGSITEEVPDLYTAVDKLAGENARLKQELVRADAVTAEAKKQWHKFRKERDFHRMHHRRVGFFGGM